MDLQNQEQLGRVTRERHSQRRTNGPTGASEIDSWHLDRNSRT